jgi:four helix bundle protein
MLTYGGRYVLGSALRALVSLPQDAPVGNNLVTRWRRSPRDSSMQDFRKIRAWQENRQLTVRIYKVTATFPAAERFGLIAQMRDAVVSIGANIAEGCGRGTRADTRRFFQMSFSSNTELLHHLITSLDLEFLNSDEFKELDQQVDSIRRKLAKFMSRLRGR